MSLAVAVPFGLASAVVYGTSIVVQHKCAQEDAEEHGASAKGLLRLIKRPLFLVALGGDLVGFLFNLVALSTGPVVIIQPLVVLMLPVALVVGYLLGGHKPTWGDYLGVAAVLGGLAAFLALIGIPGEPHIPKYGYLVVTIATILVLAIGACLLVIGRSKTLRGSVYGAAAGACFGTLAMLVDAASERLSEFGFSGLVDSPRGLVPVIGMFVVGSVGMILTQMSFQVGALGATLPANLAADPFVAVLLGVLVLREHIPLDPLRIVAYLACFAVVTAGAIKLANPSDDPLGKPCPDDAAAPVEAAAEDDRLTR